MKYFDKIYAKIEDQRRTGQGLNRFGVMDEDGKVLYETKTGPCFSAIAAGNPTGKYLWNTWNGERPERMEYGHKEWKPGPLSDRWLKFLIDPDLSPWHPLLPHLLNNDFDKIRSSGFIFDVSDVAHALIYNFLIASRQAYEHEDMVKLWARMQDQYGVHPAMAYVLCHGLKSKGDVKPPKILVKEGYYKRDPEDRRRYLRDRYGNGIIVPAVYADPPPVEVKGEERFTVVMSPGHTPLPGMSGYIRKCTNRSPSLEGKPSYQKKAGNYAAGNAWDIFNCVEEVRLLGKLMKEIEGNTMPNILKVINENLFH